MENLYRSLNYTQRNIQGDLFEKSYTGVDRDPDGTETPIDISQKTLRGTARPDFDSTTEVDMNFVKFDSGTGTVDSFIVSIPHSESTNMEPATWVYDIQLTDDNDLERVETIIKGNFIVRAEVTK